MRELVEGSFSIAARPILARINGFTLSRQVAWFNKFGCGKRWHCEQMLVARSCARSNGTAACPAVGAKAGAPRASKSQIRRGPRKESRLPVGRATVHEPARGSERVENAAAHFPSPLPSPRGEGVWSSAGRVGRAHGDCRWRPSPLPLPGGEGRGEGKAVEPTTLAATIQDL